MGKRIVLPDVQLLTEIADIFGVSIDRLFGRTEPVAEESGTMPCALPWEDDELHIEFDEENGTDHEAE